MKNETYYNLAKYLLAANRSTKIRWRRTPIPILTGTASAILEQFNLRTSNAEALASLLQNLYKNEDTLYLPETPSPWGQAQLGKLLKERVKGLSDPEKEAQNMLKVWLTADPVRFASLDVPKLLRYNSSRSVSIKIPLDGLLTLILNWDYHKNNFITQITKEYSYNNYTQKGTE